MATSGIPFNISLLHLTPETLRGIKPVTALDWFDGSSKNFHEEGLFSISIFGKVGDERRNRAFSYMDIRVNILHPIVYRSLTKMKSLYEEIMSSKTYAKWNKERMDFEKSTMIDGSTGYEFFMKHWKQIKFEMRPSVTRELNVKMLQKYKDVAELNKIVIMPAGLRDLEIQPDGRFSEDEINELYRKLLSLANSVTPDAVETSIEVLNGIRYSMQVTFNQIFTLIENMMQGKNKLIMGKWASRKVFNGTRNVITSSPVKNETLSGEGNITSNDTVVGMYQYMKASLPITLFDLKNGFLSKVFTGPDQPVTLVDKKTLKPVTVRLKPEYYDSWATNEGLEKIVTQFQEDAIRHKVLEINDHYLGLIYKGKDDTFKIIQDIDEVPDYRSKKDVRPLTFCELLYLSTYKSAKRLYGFVTRYPITGTGSIYPSPIYLKSTVQGQTRTELDDEWNRIEENTCYNFPSEGGEFVNSLSPGSKYLLKLGADPEIKKLCRLGDINGSFLLFNGPLLQ